MKKFIILAIIIFVGFRIFGSPPASHEMLDIAAGPHLYTEMTPYAKTELEDVSFSELQQKIAQRKVAAAIIIEEANASRKVITRLRSGEVTTTPLLHDERLLQDVVRSLKEEDIPFAFEKRTPSLLGQLLFSILPLIFLVLIFLFISSYIRRMMSGGGGKGEKGKNGKRGGGGLFGIGRTPSPLTKVVNPSTTLKDVGGINHIREDIEEVIAKILASSERGYLGADTPKGFLFIGPPGNAKTLLARAIAGEVARGRADGKPVTFFTVSASNFVEMFVGQGAARVRAMFEELIENTPCILFIDELDSLGKRGGSGPSSGGSDEREQTLNQMLVCMDGFSENHDITFIGATNRVDKIDDALLRPGRFSRQVTMPLPDLTGREEILHIHARKLRYRAMTNQIARKVMAGEETRSIAGKILSGEVSLDDSEVPEVFADDVNFHTIARETPGCSGAELEEILKRSAELAEAEGLAFIRIADIRNAYQSLRMGDEMPRVLDFEDEFTTAVHEIIGHAVVMGHTRQTLGHHHADDIMSMTIIPRGMALGAVWNSPTKDRVSHSLKYLLGRIRIASGGQIAEKLYMGPDEVTSGASSDIKAATQIARAMVSECAMVDAGGRLTFRNYMEDTGFGLTKAQEKLVDAEIDRVLKEQYCRTVAIILSYAEATDREGNNLLEMLARAMLVKKTLQGEEFMRLLDGEVVFPRADLDLGENEETFTALWQRHEITRTQTLQTIRESYPQIAAEYGL